MGKGKDEIWDGSLNLDFHIVRYWQTARWHSQQRRGWVSVEENGNTFHSPLARGQCSFCLLDCSRSQICLQRNSYLLICFPLGTKASSLGFVHKVHKSSWLIFGSQWNETLHFNFVEQIPLFTKVNLSIHPKYSFGTSCPTLLQDSMCCWSAQLKSEMQSCNQGIWIWLTALCSARQELDSHGGIRAQNKNSYIHTYIYICIKLYSVIKATSYYYYYYLHYL